MSNIAKIIDRDKKGNYYVKFEFADLCCPFSELKSRKKLECDHAYAAYRCKYFVKHKWHMHEFCIICSHPPMHQPTEQYLF